MIAALFGLLLVLQVPDSLQPAFRDAYADEATRVLVTQARAARDRNERLVTAYTATAKQRIGVGIRARSRDRMLYRQELVARITWKRDSTSSVEVVGAREGIPIALKGDRVPEDLDDQTRSLVINPAQDYLRLIGNDDEGFVYPLRDGGEEDYRFALGDSATITLPDGKRIRLVALQVIPRRSDWRLIAGTLWFDRESHGLVQAVFRPARPYEFKRDSDESDREDVPSFVNPKGEVKFITLEYGLYENRWWMMRYVAIDLAGSMGSWLDVPVRFERVYEDYEVEGGTPPKPGSTFRPAGTLRMGGAQRSEDPEERRRAADSISVVIQECVDSAVAAATGSDGRVRNLRRACRRAGWISNLTVVIPTDTAAMLSHTELGPPILAMGDLITEDEIRGLRGAIEGLPAQVWAPHFDLPSGASAFLQHARYNRVEALSLGLGGRLDLGPLAVTGVARLGVADLVPNAEIAVSRLTPNARMGLTVYRRLAAANPDTKPFGPFNSFLGLVSGRDDGEYYRTLGVEFAAANANSGWWSARLYAQRERPADVETRASLPRIFDGSRTFRPNITADSADLVGASLTLRGTKAFSRSITVGGEVTMDGATGDFDLGRASTTARVFVTPPGPLAGAWTISAGTSTGEVPVQHAYYLGGAATLRGYAGGVLVGDAFWLSRFELGNSFPAVRLIGFTDVGWAGPRNNVGTGKPLIGAGVGASFFDGLVRIDLARGLRSPTGTRLEFYVDGIL